MQKLVHFVWTAGAVVAAVVIVPFALLALTWELFSVFFDAIRPEKK